LKELENAVTALRDGELVAFPTETVYGLGANAQNPVAVRRIFELKERPADHPVIVHLDNPKYLHRWARDVPENAQKLAARFWPGPLTMVPSRSENCDVVTAVGTRSRSAFLRILWPSSAHGLRGGIGTLAIADA
jgi:L-threonylcarbamoyladenylate synthase